MAGNSRWQFSLSNLGRILEIIITHLICSIPPWSVLISENHCNGDIWYRSFVGASLDPIISPASNIKISIGYRLAVKINKSPLYETTATHFIVNIVTVGWFLWLLKSPAANERLQRLRLLRLSRTQSDTDVSASERIITGLLRRSETAGESSGESSGTSGVSYIHGDRVTLPFHCH